MGAIQTNFLFPPQIIPVLCDLRDSQWRVLIRQMSDRDSDDLERIGLVLMMIRLCGCTTCQGDSFKAMRGCASCATQSVRRFKGNDSDLIVLVENAVRDVTEKLTA